MSKLRIIYIASLVILGVLVAFTLFRLMPSEEEFSTVTRKSIIKLEDQWIIQVDIINRDGEDSDYSINWSTGGEIYSSRRVSIKNGRTFTNIHHVYPEAVKEGKVHLTIYKEDEAVPFQESTFYIRFD